MGTPSKNVEILPIRIGVDTGAYLSNRLSAVVLEGAETRVIQTGEISPALFDV
jgi:hypothetical protein